MRTAGIAFFVLLLLAANHPAAWSYPGSAITVIVSPSGSDRWSGTLSSPNISRTDGPVASLERARDIARGIRANLRTAADTVVIVLRGGTYRRTQTFRLTSADGGTEAAPAIWRAFRGEQVRINGGMPVAAFTQVQDAGILRRLPAAVRARVLVSDLHSAGLTDFGTITPRGNPGLELFFNGKRLQLARWPDADWLLIADVPQTGDSMFNKGLDREKRFDGVPVGRHFGRIRYDGSRPSGWSAENEIYAHGYWTWDWSDSFQKIQRVDTAAHEILFAPPHHHYGYTKHQRYYFLNILEELDQPGEWYLDRGHGLLYVLPPSPPAGSSAEVSVLESPLFQFDSCSHVLLQGLDFEVSRGDGILVQGGEGVTIAGCSFRNLGGSGVIVASGSHHTLMDSRLQDLAGAGIILRGGNRHTLQRGDNTVRNTHIHHYSRWLHTGNYAVVFDGVGQTMEHCLVHDAPFEAIYVKGNDHLVAFNEIHSVVRETGDAGALHTGRNWTWRGNVIRNNYFHDLRGPGLHGVMAVYLDDWASGFRVEGNVFYRSGRSAMIGGGRDNIVENNVFIECSPSVHLDARGIGWASYYFDGTTTTLFDGLAEVQSHEPPYSTRYPELSALPGPTQALPMNNRVENNISWGGRWMDIYDAPAFDLHVSTFRGNIVADSLVLRRRKDGEKGWDPYYLNIDWTEGFESLTRTDPRIRQMFPDEKFVADQPLLFDPVARKFTIPDHSPLRHAHRLLPPIEQMGLLK